MFIKFLFQHFLFNQRHKSWNPNIEQLREELLKKQAIEYRQKAIKLQGLMIKVGQFLSTRADMFPKAFLDELEGLIDKVPPIPSEKSLKVLEREWGGDIKGYLKSITEKPVASASIGEVYKATLHNGQKVAIKIQRYRIDEIIHTDFKALRIVLWIAQHFTSLGKRANLKGLYKEMVQVIGNELNYEKELENGQYFHKRYHGKNNILVPQFYEEYSTRKVLVMEWMDGAKVTDKHFIEKHHLDRKKIAESLFEFFVEELIDCGVFHADPHPGNILVNKKGQLIIIDFGMIGKIKKEDEHYLKTLLKGFMIKDYKLIIEQLELLGFFLPHADKRYMENMLRQYVEAYFENSVSVLDKELIESIMFDIQELVRTQPIQLPAEYAFLGRAALIALGVMTAVDPNMDLLEMYKPVIREWLEEGEKDKSSFPSQLLKEAALPLLTIPRNVNDWLEAPKIDRQESREQHWEKMEHERKIHAITFSTTLSIISFIFVFLAILFEHLILLISAASIAIITLINSINFYFKHRSWVSQHRGKH